MSEYLIPNRIVQIEAPDGWEDAESFRTELAPFLFVFTGVCNRSPTPGVQGLIQELSEDLRAPVLDVEGEMLVAWWDGACDRTRKWIARAGARKVPAMVIRY